MQWPPLPDYGCFPRWPADDESFIHADDRTVALRCLPSYRVLRREKFDGTYYHYSYGQLSFRLTPVMWLPVRYEGIDIGDEVETVGVSLERELFVGSVWGMYFVSRKGCILYRLKRGDLAVPRLYPAKSLRLLHDKSTISPRNFDYRQPQWIGKPDNPEERNKS